MVKGKNEGGLEKNEKGINYDFKFSRKGWKIGHNLQ
jgi:hypothetical protein